MSLVKDLSFRYGDFVIEVPHWEILDQGVTALSGPSGSGKSSLFRLLVGLEQPKMGQWLLSDGVDLLKLPISERRLGVVFQSLDLFPHLSAKENILFAAKARGLSSEEYSKELVRLVDGLQMDSFIERKASHLSGGERQRVAIARAIIGKPRYLLFDEPFSALDVPLRQEGRRLVKSLIQEYKIPLILITHDPDDIEFLANKVTLISAGRV